MPSSLRTVKCFVAAIAFILVLICAVGSISSLRHQVTVEEALHPIVISSYQPRPLRPAKKATEAKPNSKTSGAKPQPTPQPGANP